MVLNYGSLVMTISCCKFLSLSSHEDYLNCIVNLYDLIAIKECLRMNTSDFLENKFFNKFFEIKKK